MGSCSRHIVLRPRRSIDALDVQSDPFSETRSRRRPDESLAIRQYEAETMEL